MHAGTLPARPEDAPAVETLPLHVEEERRGPAACLQPLRLLSQLACLLAVLAAQRERQRAQTTLGDFVGALEAVAEGALVQTAERLLNLVAASPPSSG